MGALWYLLVRLARRLTHGVADCYRYAEPNLMPIGWVGVVGFPLYYVIWEYAFPQPYESLIARTIGALAFLPLALHRHVPRSLQRYMPAYWTVATLYALPFFFTFMLLKNDMNTVWAMSTMAGLFLLVLLVSDWLILAMHFVGGTVLAWIAHSWTGGSLVITANYLEQLPIYLFVLVAGSVFNYKSELLKRERQDAMLSVSRSVAHELRTPLLSIRSGVNGVNKYFGALVDGYQQAREAGLPVQPVRAGHARALEPVLDRVLAETDYSNVMIDMLLVNAGRDQVDTSQFRTVDMADCVATALSRYPFRSERERRSVRVDGSVSFQFHGSDVLTIHILFNLLRNALEAVAEAGDEGEVRLWADASEDSNRLHVRDNGVGIPPEQLPHIFRRFFSGKASHGGAGIGLYFCQLVMESYGGGIECRSVAGQYAEFILTFPKLSRTP